MKVCFIIPYFGHLPNYFSLFLKTCAYNKNFDWLLITDDPTPYNYPNNFRVIYMSFEENYSLIQSKFDFQVALERAGEAAERRLEVERIAEDVGDDAREDPDVHKHDDERHHDIQQAHDRHEHARDIGQALAAAEHAQGEQHRKDRADDVRRAALDIEAEAAERILQVVGGEHIKAHDIGQDQHDREHDAEPALMQRLLHVVRRAAVAAAVRIALFVDLRERRLDERTRTADQRHDPHPEHGAEATETDGRGHADDVARADARRRGHHERTEGRNAALLFRLFLDNADRLTEQPELDQPGADREIQTRGEQKQRHDVRPVQKTADRIDNSVN